MNKILVIGCTGSGKTVFSKKLSEKLGIPLYTIDDLYYNEDWQRISQEELKERLKEVMQGEKWILDGNYTRLIPFRLEYSDTVIFFDLPKIVSIWRVCKRYITYKGNKRPNIFYQMKLILQYPTEKVYEILDEYTEQCIIVFKHSIEVKRFLNSLR